MPRLAHDSGGAVDLKCRQVLGDDSPLEFDDDGYAWVDDETAAEQIAALHTHVTVEPAAPAPDADDEDDDAGGEDGAFDAEAFVDRTPMDDVVEDLDTGEYDAHLDAIEAAADRQGVLEAIAERRDAETDTE